MVVNLVSSLYPNFACWWMLVAHWNSPSKAAEPIGRQVCMHTPTKSNSHVSPRLSLTWLLPLVLVFAAVLAAGRVLCHGDDSGCH